MLRSRPCSWSSYRGPVINWVKGLRFKEEIRETGTAEPQGQGRDPDHGRIIILGAVLVSIVFGEFREPLLLVLIGGHHNARSARFVDDYIKSVLKRKRGFRAGKACRAVRDRPRGIDHRYYFPSNPQHATTLFVPFMNEPILDLGVLWIFFAMIVIVGSRTP